MPSWLQWSHGVAAVETPGGAGNRSGPGRCFNGATASPPWKPAGGIDFGTIASASMEPRRRRRGNRCRRNGDADPDAASMEPRRRRRGNSWRRRCTSAVALLQWSHGVAAVETRKSFCRSLARFGGFNGATASPPWKRGHAGEIGLVDKASMEPRRRRRGNFAIAEGAAKVILASMEPRRRRRGNLRHRPGHADGLDASMEPRRRRRGNRVPTPMTYTDKHGLQWSHGVAAVETARLSHARAEDAVASMEPRRRRRGNLIQRRGFRVGLTKLQWSHGVAAVETHEALPRAAGPWSASMEPRRRRRGNGDPGALRHRQAAGFNGATASPPWKLGLGEPRAELERMLQWSHGVAAVETSVRAARPRGQLCFNGATASPPWKRGLQRPRPAPGLGASMEPRRRRRGNSPPSNGMSYSTLRGRFRAPTRSRRSKSQPTFFAWDRSSRIPLSKLVEST